MRDALLSTVSYGALELGWRAARRDEVERLLAVNAIDGRARERVELRMLRDAEIIRITHRAFFAKGIYRFASILFLTVLQSALKTRFGNGR